MEIEDRRIGEIILNRESCEELLEAREMERNQFFCCCSFRFDLDLVGHEKLLGTGILPTRVSILTMQHFLTKLLFIFQRIYASK